MSAKPGGKCPSCGAQLSLGNFTCDLEGTCNACGAHYFAKRVVQWRTRVLPGRTKYVSTRPSNIIGGEDGLPSKMVF